MSLVIGHIHLDTDLGVPENAPISTWKVVDRLVVPTVVVSLKRTLTGKLKKHRLTRNGSVVQMQDYQYTLIIKDNETETALDQLARLLALHGKTAYLVDNHHCADGEDHTEYVRQVFVSEIAPPAHLDNMLRYFTVDVKLTDDYTVT